MKPNIELILFLALKKAETIYFNGGDWKGFLMNLIAELEKELEKDPFVKDPTRVRKIENQFLQ